MASLGAFLYGVSFVLMAGAAVTLWFARRAAAESRSHEGRRPSVTAVARSVKTDAAA